MWQRLAPSQDVSGSALLFSIAWGVALGRSFSLEVPGWSPPERRPLEQLGVRFAMGIRPGSLGPWTAWLAPFRAQLIVFILNHEPWQGREAARHPVCKSTTSVQLTGAWGGGGGWSSASVTACWISLALTWADITA